MNQHSPSPPERRSFLTYLNVGFTSLAAMALGSAAIAQTRSTATTRWDPAHHEKDDWLDKQPAKHRMVFDTTSPEGFGQALAFAANFMAVNRSEYSLQNSDLAVVIMLRHQATPFGYNDTIWAKYGTAIAAECRFEDPKSRTAPKTNVYNSRDYGNLLPNRSVTLDLLSPQGVQFAVCSVATRRFAGAIAQTVGGNADTINSELIGNLVSNARMVPAGIVAVGRAQERGYSLVTT